MLVMVSNSIILTSIIESEAAIDLLGNFLCVNDAVNTGAPIPYRQSHFTISNNGGDYMEFVQVGQSFPDSKESKEFIKKAFEAATKCIKDWEGAES